MGYGWDGCEEIEHVGEENIKDIRAGGTARNMESKN